MSETKYETSKPRTVIVAGSQSISAKGVFDRYASLPNTTVYGLSRRQGESSGNAKHISVDLLNPEDVEAKVGNLTGVTHMVFGAYLEKQTAAERSQVNTALLKNLLDVLQKSAPELEHVTIYQGGKAYGSDLGPFKTPAREDDPRLMPPNFYYDQEDLLRERQKGSSWTFTVLRPEAICGLSLGSPMNLTMVIAIYAAISRELGIPLRFPGTEKAYRALYQLTSADILSAATVWAGESKAAQNEIFNITNGDTFRWQHMWPKIAKVLDMEIADPTPFPLTTYMEDKAPVWDAIVAKYGLQPILYRQVVSWGFGDMIFNSGFDNVSSTVKARLAGFHDCIDTETMFHSFFQSLRSKKIIPQ
jgi:nucleoside-diphosphate-sugar epimerase